MARKITVLLVEADPAVRDALQHALIVENYHVTTAATAEEAREKLQTERVDLALLDADFNSPARGSLLRELRHSHPGLSTILMSGEGDLNEEGWDWMEKPLNLPLLFGRLQELTVGHG